MTCRGYITYDDGKSWRILNAAQTCMKGRILSFDSFWRIWPDLHPQQADDSILNATTDV
jgi:hypothetical protein